jgi:putative transposase
MLKAIKIRLYLTDVQEDYVSRLLGSCRFVYNNCLAYRVDKYNNENKTVGFADLGKYLTNLKSTEEYLWLRDAHSKVLQQTLINLDTAYKNFFKNGSGFPNFKSKHDNRQSCRFPVDAIGKIYGNRINIIKPLSNIHFKCSKQDEIYLNKNKHLIKSATLTRTKNNNYYFSILIEKPNKELVKPINDVLGIDLGIKDFIVDSNGNSFENIKVKRNNQKKLNKLHRELSRKEKGSRNREKARIKLAKLYEKINNQKEYYLHHVVNQLLSENQTIVMEDLNVKGMMKNHKLARSIQELSINRFKNMLEYKALWYGRDIIQIDRFFPSSKLCSNCGSKNDYLKLEHRKWTCTKCNTTHNRDVNAAINILNEGKRILNIKQIGLSSPELTPLEIGSAGINNKKSCLSSTQSLN